MCGELGRWLRVAGYDTVIEENSSSDREIFERAVLEGRLLITKDRHFLSIDPERKTIVYLLGESLDEWVEQLKKQGVDWQYSPFSRCLQCNSLLEKATADEGVPEQVREHVKEFWKCSSCRQIFWRGSHTEHMEEQLKTWKEGDSMLIIGLGGDLMIGRLIDEYLNTHPPSCVWGNLHPLLGKMDLNLVNLETTLTHSEEIVPKVFNFKASPEKVAVLKEGPIHVVNIANNHILDFSEKGLLETIKTLDKAHIPHVGAGKDLASAKEPVIIEKKGIKIGILGCTDNEPDWKASRSSPGVNYIEVGDLKALRSSIVALRKQVDLLILSIHWGPNMRKRPSPSFRSFAHELIDLGVDILHGHSAHVFQGVEVYKHKLILYDTGELVDDYAIDPVLRNDRSFFFVVKIDKKKLVSLQMFPILISHFHVNHSKDTQQLAEMESLCKELKTSPIRQDDTLIIEI